MANCLVTISASTLHGGRVERREQYLAHGTLRILQDHASVLQRLAITCVRTTVGAQTELLGLMSSAMPHLRELNIEEDGDRLYPFGMALTLKSQCFPSLRKLILRGASATISPPIAAGLRCLVLESRQQRLRSALDQQPPPVSTAHVLEVLSNLASIEELTIRNYFGHLCPAPFGGHAHPPANVRSLKKLTIHEETPIISVILSRLAMPANTHISLKPLDIMMSHTSPHASGRGPLEALSRVGRGTPNLGHVSHVRISRTREGYRIQAGTDREESLDFPLEAASTTDPDGRPSHQEVFEQLLAFAAEFFRRGPVTRLSRCGNFDGVRSSAWLLLLDSLPGLQELDFKDSTYRGSAIPLLSALMTPSPATRRPVCPSLRHVTLSSRMSGVDVLVNVHQCFEWRQSTGLRGPLASILVQVCPTLAEIPKSPSLMSFVSRYTELFRRYARESKVTIVPAALPEANRR
ncbi:hypothetical protein C8Q77DRAFT_500157 [Trametes polyzona]|nr:hypothetical protein C8Q77DRAFT_500157 [Trametes polyzona]